MWKKDEIHFFAPTVDALHVAPPTGPKRYVEHSTRGNVLIVDASSNTIAGVNQVPIGVNPANADHDGDGHVAIAWGGDDCDDSDPSRYPTNTEVPDSDMHDEDCDPLTFGCADADGDRWCDARACNRDPSGAMRCGDDCDDNDANVHPAQVDVCNGKDDNCNGLIDEGLIGCPTTQH